MRAATFIGGIYRRFDVLQIAYTSVSDELRVRVDLAVARVSGYDPHYNCPELEKANRTV